MEPIAPLHDRTLRRAAMLGAALVLTPCLAMATEGGAGFYLLGTRAINAGIVPPSGAYLQGGLYACSGSTSATVPQGGRLDIDLKGNAAIGLATASGRPPPSRSSAAGPTCS